MKTIGSIIYIALVSILGHYIGELLPRKWFNYDSTPWKDLAWEEQGSVYDKLKIKKWKNKVPDLSRIMRYMVPKRVSAKSTAKDIDTLLKETCVAEFIHFATSVAAVGACFIADSPIGIVFWLLYCIANVPFILIQRYNRPHLKRLLNKMILRDKNQAKSFDVI